MTRRNIVRLCGGSVAASLLSFRLSDLPRFSAKRLLKVELKGELATLEELPGRSNVVFADSAVRYDYYHFAYKAPSKYYGKYKSWERWSDDGYLAYMKALTFRHKWLSPYQKPMADLMREYYSNGNILSQPFPLDTVESVYSFGNKAGSEVVLGVSRKLQRVVIDGKSVRLWSAIASLTRSEPLEEKERVTGAQSDSSSRQVTPKGSDDIIEGFGYDTVRGGVFISRSEYRNTGTNERGCIIIYDAKDGKVQRLVSV